MNVSKLRAYAVLEDARRAHECWELINADGQLSRIYQVATIALLRAVGHVLRNVDAKADPLLAKGTEEWFSRVKADRPAYSIFWDFIESSRNLALKEYVLPGELLEQALVSGTSEEPALSSIDMVLFEDGPFLGEDVRDVALTAIEFWQETLERLASSQQ